MARTDGTPQFADLNELSAERSTEPEWREGEFTDCGKWMDGWETRRRRSPGHDWAIIKLCFPGQIKGVYVDTAYFTGNFVPRISLQAAHLTSEEQSWLPPRVSRLGTAATPQVMEQVERLQSHAWREVLPRSALRPGRADSRHHYLPAQRAHEVWSHVRLNLFPDGGVARLRLYGVARPIRGPVDGAQLVDVISMERGGVCVSYSNAHYGHPRNVIRPGRGTDMADGWETARRLDRPCVLEEDENGILKVPGSEWAVFKLAHCGTIDSIEVDTLHFKGNYPDSVWLEGSLGDDLNWKTCLPRKKLSPHRLHAYTRADIHHEGPFSHVRVTIAPDGGISRLRVWGRAA
ncbi:allantoicase-like isoform X2 [Bacillus rossius redtenbacheri]|uniref:allantoicase-like isoform X2 n=1 Tax=Bacillus rossius redtenbacheri TaxID=93214 RepID=UPI002FDCE6AB